jgi:hypothetical protein
MLAVGVNKLSVPRLVKRALETVIATALAAGVLFIIVVGNGLLVGRGGTVQGFNAWIAFMMRGDVLPLLLLSSAVTTLYLAWDRDRRK